MIHAHRMIEMLRNYASNGIGPPINEITDPKQPGLFANLIEVAEKFDFGPLVLEKDLSGPHKYKLPDLTDVEWDVWGQKLITLPSNPSWFKYELNGVRSALLVYSTENEEEQDRWCVVRFELAPRLWWDAVMVAVKRESQKHNDYTRAEMHSCWIKTNLLTDDEKRMLWGDQTHMSIYLTLALASKTTEKKAVKAPTFTNKQRAKKGKAPLPAHTVVRIVPYRYISESQREAGRTHASPRLHFRRAHIRVFDHRTPGSTYVDGYIAGRKVTGWVVPIAQTLVGKAEDGEVSHEYFVENENKLKGEVHG